MCESLNFSTVPPRRCTTCNDLLTLEMEFDEGVCVDCMADLALLHPATDERAAS